MANGCFGVINKCAAALRHVTKVAANLDEAQIRSNLRCMCVGSRLGACAREAD